MKQVIYIFFVYLCRLMIKFYSKISCLILLKQKYIVSLNHCDRGVYGFPVDKIPRQPTQVFGDCSLTPQSHFYTMGVYRFSPNKLGSITTGIALKAN